MRKFFSLILLFTFILIFAALLPAQDLPRVAVLPFNPVGVSEAEAQILTNLFETAVVNTGAFEVIEQNQADNILTAQEYSLGGCTDETCAVEIGRLLAAENIILGTVSKLGAKFIVTAKIIDVTSGKNIRADSVEGMAIEDMSAQVNVLAGLLTDITVAAPGRTGPSPAGTGQGELFINSRPEGARIFIDGAEKGTTPALVSGLKPGTVLVEVRKADTYAAENVTVAADRLTEVTLDLQDLAGRIFIVTEDKTLQVYLDGQSRGALGDGLLKDVGVGEHLVELKSADRYWKGTVTVEMGKTARVEARPVGKGIVAYDLPEGATAVVAGSLEEKKITGRGEVQLPEDRYDVVVSGVYYQTLRTAFSVKTGIKTEFRPELEFADTDEAAAYQASLRIAGLEEQRKQLKREIRSIRKSGTWQTVGWISSSVGAAGVLTALTGIVAGLVAKSAYDSAVDSVEVLRQRKIVENCTVALMAGAGTAALFGGAGVPLILLTGETTPEDEERREELINRLEAVETEIEHLEKQAAGGAE